VKLRIEGTDLPGRSAVAVGGGRAVVVGVQRRGRPGEILDPQPWDADRVAWTLECTLDPATLDPRGPYVEGRPGERFVYLSWGESTAEGFAMFRRAKLMLDAVPPATLRAAAGGSTLVGRLGLTDGRGGPLCAAVRPPAITWSAS
jgi:hypothetical protein